MWKKQKTGGGVEKGDRKNTVSVLTSVSTKHTKTCFLSLYSRATNKYSSHTNVNSYFSNKQEAAHLWPPNPVTDTHFVNKQQQKIRCSSKTVELIKDEQKDISEEVTPANISTFIQLQ